MGDDLYNELHRRALEDGDSVAAIAVALVDVAGEIKSLGTGDAYTPFGAVEALGMTLKDGMAEIARSLQGIARATAEKD